MAKTLAFSPQFQNLKNQILGTRLIRQVKSSISHSHNQISCDNSYRIHKKSSTINRTIENVQHFGGFTIVSVTPLPCVLDSNKPLYSSRHRHRLSSLSLLPLRRSRSPYFQLFLMSSNSPSDASTNQPQGSAKTIKCVIKGRVQGVFYRNWTVENATQLGLKGWVRNRIDGSVEAMFCGKPEVVDEMLQRCRRGPPDAMVTALEATPCNEDPGTGFQRRSTV